jgi:hypothetical protein
VPFACSICEQESTRICMFCTKDACDIHICERCGCCSDCCDCDVPLDEPLHTHLAEAGRPVAPFELDPSGFSLLEFDPLLEGATELPVRDQEADAATIEPWPAAEPQPATPEESAAEPSETPESLPADPPKV